jgi:hypothetical protein
MLVPVKTEISPLSTPSTVVMDTVPGLVPDPPDNDSDPPGPFAVDPATIDAEPPIPDLLAPTATTTSPAIPSLLLPDDNRTEPLLPTSAEPLPMTIAPELLGLSLDIKLTVPLLALLPAATPPDLKLKLPDVLDPETSPMCADAPPTTSTSAPWPPPDDPA